MLYIKTLNISKIFFKKHFYEKNNADIFKKF